MARTRLGPLMRLRRSDDRQLLAAIARGDERAFEVFYRRHLPAVTGFHLKRTGRPEVAFDLTAETFAAVIESCDRFDGALGTPTAWVFGIAANKLYDSFRKGRVEATARQRLGHEPITLVDADLERVDELASQADDAERLAELLADLPEDVRAAVLARVVDDESYATIAARLECSEAVVRQRVHRGPQALARRAGGERMTGFDDLHRQLRESVRARAQAPAPSPGGRGPRRPRLRLAVALASCAVVGGGVALAAQIVSQGPEQPHDTAAQAAQRAVLETAGQEACRPLLATDSPHIEPVAGEVPFTRLRPDLRRFFPVERWDRQAEAEARLHLSASLVLGTARFVDVGGGLRVLLFVTTGRDLAFGVQDPAACAQLRAARLAADRPDPRDPTRARALTILQHRLDAEPGLQTLVIQDDRGGGSGIAIGPGHPLPIGVVLTSAGTGYTGVAAIGAATIAVDGARTHVRAPVRDGVFSFTLPPRTGPLTLRQLSASGRVLVTEPLRGRLRPRHPRHR